MKRLWAIAAVLGLFLTGVVVGVLGTHLFYAHLLRRPGGPPQLAGRFFAAALEHRLDLDREQRRQIDLILARSRERSMALRLEMQPRVQELMESTRREIEAVLTPEQLREFERLHREHERRAEQFLLGPPGPDPGRHRRFHGPPPEPPD